MARSKSRPVIGVTVGDPAGIGPEIVAHFFGKIRPSGSSALIIGSLQVLEPWAEKFGWKMNPAASADELAAALLEKKPVLVYDTGCNQAFPLGEHSRGGGTHAGVAIEAACKLADVQLIDAIVTAPISKLSLNLAGYDFPGHTEMLADHFKSDTFEMMMVYEDLRIVPLTRHLPMSEVCSHISKARAARCFTTVAKALHRLFGIERPKIVIAALNPHGGDRGLIGQEEMAIIGPAIEEALTQGMDVTGPVPGDVVFQSIEKKEYDAYITMYHDQGMIPFKMIARGRGVNLTIGLPVIRTSVDHGAAFDIAGKGEADILSLKAAYSLAEELSKRMSEAPAAD